MQATKKKVLLFGSGLMSESVIDYLLKRPENQVHIASNIKDDARAIAERNGLDRCSYSQVDVSDPKAVGDLVSQSDIVISYVPAFLHINIAKVCIEHKKNLVTASYVSPEMKELDKDAKDRDLIFLNELGLDPGIDHLATMKIVHETEKQGGKILQYESWCGGLPSPQFCDNPLGYKFTWSPIGALRALNNKAIFLQNSQQVVIQGKVLQYHVSTIELNQALTLEGYPNRNSVAYKQIYGLKDATKVLRGTLRYKGFCQIVCAWKQLGLLDEKPIPQNLTKWVQLLQNIAKQEAGQNLEQKIKNKCFNKIQSYEQLNASQKQKKIQYVLKGFKYFGMFDSNTEIWNNSKTLIENLVNLLEKKLSMKEGQTDLIAMQHIFLIEKDGKKTLKKSTLISIGDKKGFTSMARTVGSPTGIGAQLILDNKISERGVCIPKYPDIYEPVLEQLAKLNIKLNQTQESI